MIKAIRVHSANHYFKNVTTCWTHCEQSLFLFKDTRARRLPRGILTRVCAHHTPVKFPRNNQLSLVFVYSSRSSILKQKEGLLVSICWTNYSLNGPCDLISV